jgi:hypothetical protein
MMTPRERLLAALHGDLPDRLPWAPEFNIRFCERIVKEVPGGPYAPEDLYLEACRRMGAECFLRVDAVEVTYPNVKVSESRGNGEITRVYHTPLGKLTARSRLIPDIGGEMEFQHLVGTVEEVRAYRFMYQDGQYRPRYQFVRKQIARMGEAGVISIFGPPTPLLDLIMFPIRLPNIYFLMADHPQEMEALLHSMHLRNCEYYELAAEAPGEVVRSFEDTSTTLVSPGLYRRHCLKQLQEYRDICHARGKLFVPHMCGLLKGVLPELRDTGLDGIEAVTPPPLGDTPIGLAREKLGPEVTLIGGLDPTQFLGATPDKTRAMIKDYLSQIGDGRRMVLGHEEIHIKADLDSVRVVPEVLEEWARFPLRSDTAP